VKKGGINEDGSKSGQATKGGKKKKTITTSEQCHMPSCAHMIHQETGVKNYLEESEGHGLSHYERTY